MKKEWKKPTLEMLDVQMTMASSDGTHYDGNYSHNTQHVPDVYFPQS